MIQTIPKTILCFCSGSFFFFNDTATTEIYTLSLHDALPISSPPSCTRGESRHRSCGPMRSEEHTSELQSHVNLVCRLLLEKKKTNTHTTTGLTTEVRAQNPDQLPQSS